MSKEENERTKKVYEKILEFIKSSLKYTYKEIGLSDTSCFEIKRTDKVNYDFYEIKYGFRQSGSIELGFVFNKNKDYKMAINYTNIFTQPSNMRYQTVDYNIPVNNVTFNYGEPLGTKKYSTLSEIEENPNALELLDSAIFDLNTAVILGKCNYKSVNPKEELLTVGQKIDRRNYLK